MKRTLPLLAILALLSLQNEPPKPAPNPLATVNLMTREGVDTFRAQWRYADVKIIPTPDGKTHDIDPKAGATDFDDSKWEVLDPTTLEKPRGPGQLCFAWYRIRLTVPEKVGDVDTAGCAIDFETVVDDYGE